LKVQYSANPIYSSPKTSRWLSGDPAMGDYFPSAHSPSTTRRDPVRQGRLNWDVLENKYRRQETE